MSLNTVLTNMTQIEWRPIIFAKFVKKYKLISHVVHSHINDPFGSVGIVAFGGSPFETLAREWEIS